MRLGFIRQRRRGRRDARRGFGWGKRYQIQSFQQMGAPRVIFTRKLALEGLERLPAAQHAVQHAPRARVGKVQPQDLVQQHGGLARITLRQQGLAFLQQFFYSLSMRHHLPPGQGGFAVILIIMA